MSCNHQATKSTWVENDDWHESYSATGYWEYSTVSTAQKFGITRQEIDNAQGY